MSLKSIFTNPIAVLTILIVLGVILVFLALFLLRRKKRGSKDKAPPPPSLSDESIASPAAEAIQYAAAESSTNPPVPLAPAFPVIRGRHLFISDLFRAFLILLSIVVAAGVVLIVLPQTAADRMTQKLQSRQGSSQSEKIALLFLGDEIKGNEFHVRGIVRNITADPVNQLDAAIRFYSSDGNLLETTVLRMSKDIIAPDEVAQFELVYPNYQSEFGSYSVEFKLRQGDFMPYKDMRGVRKTN